MKKTIYLIVVILVILSSCSDLESMMPIYQSAASAISDSTALNPNELPLIEETTTIAHEEIDITTNEEENINSTILGIGGDYDVFEEKYCFFSDGIISIPNTITDSRSNNFISSSNIVYEYEKIYKNNDGTFVSERPPFLYYYVQEAKVTEEEIIEYINGIKNFSYTKELYIPNNAVEALLSEDINYAKQILKSPLAVYAGGNIYNTYELLDMDKDSIEKLNISQEEMETYQKNINEYFELHKEYFVNEDSYYGKFKNEVIDFLEQDIIFNILN